VIARAAKSFFWNDNAGNNVDEGDCAKAEDRSGGNEKPDKRGIQVQILG
jgi:hypothetical protein